MSTPVSLPLNLKTTQEINITPFPQFLSCKLGLRLNAKGIHEERDTAGCMPRTDFLPRTAARWNQAVLATGGNLRSSLSSIRTRHVRRSDKFYKKTNEG